MAEIQRGAAVNANTGVGGVENVIVRAAAVDTDERAVEASTVVSTACETASQLRTNNI